MMRFREHILGLALALIFCVILSWAHILLKRQPQVQALHTVNLLSSEKNDLSRFYSTEFIEEVRLQTGVDSLADDALFDRTLWFLLSNSAGFWPTVRQLRNGEFIWSFNVIAPMNRLVSLRSVRANGHLVFHHIEGMEELTLAKPDLWTKHVKSSGHIER